MNPASLPCEKACRCGEKNHITLLTLGWSSLYILHDDVFLRVGMFADDSCRDCRLRSDVKDISTLERLVAFIAV